MTSPIQEKEQSASQALVRAAGSGDLPAVQNLLASGADVNWANDGGQTALILAAVMGHAEVVTHLLGAGANPNLRDHLGLTAKEWSTRRGFSEIAQLLNRISPPPPSLRSERKTESLKTDSSKPAEPTTGDAEPTIPDAPSKAEALTVSSETEIAGDLQERQGEAEIVETPTDVKVVAAQIPAVETQPELETPTQEHVAAELHAGEAQSELVKTPPDEHVVAGELQAGEAQSELVETKTDVKVVAAEIPVGEAQSELVETRTDESAVAGELQVGEAQSELVETPTDVKVVAAEIPVGEAQPEPTEIPTDEDVVEPAALATNAAPPLTAGQDRADLVAGESESQPASAEIKSTSEPITEPAHEIGESVSAATPTPALDDLEPVSAAPFSAEHFLLHEEDDETLPQPGVAAAAPDITFSRRQSPPAVTDASEVPASGIRVPAAEKRALAFSASSLGLSEPPLGEVEAGGAFLKRCPRCGEVYRNSPLSFCTRDNATLIDVDRLHQLSPPAQGSSFPVAVWLLIAFVLGASGFAAYRLTERFFRKPEPTPAVVKPAEPVPEIKKPAFSVGGDLTGREVNIPEPEYPSELSGAGSTGPITVRIRVNKNGRVISAAATTGDTRLRSAAVKAARQATFAPDKLAEISPRGRAVTGSITYEFAAPQSSTATSPATTSAPSTTTPETSAVQPTPAATSVDPNAPVVSNELISAATNVPAPDYPTRAKRAGVGGTITVTIRVNRAGRVISWRTSAGDSQLRAAAIRAARKATFARDKLPGSGDVLGTITYRFTP